MDYTSNIDAQGMRRPMGPVDQPNWNGGPKLIHNPQVMNNQTAGQSITFDKVLLKTGCAECHRANTGSVKMRANGIYEASFAGNISGAVAGTPVQLAFQLGGATMPETTMVATPGAANASNNVATSTLIKNCCGDYDRITVTNTGTADVTVAANSAFIVRRLA